MLLFILGLLYATFSLTQYLRVLQNLRLYILGLSWGYIYAYCAAHNNEWFGIEHVVLYGGSASILLTQYRVLKTWATYILVQAEVICASAQLITMSGCGDELGAIQGLLCSIKFPDPIRGTTRAKTVYLGAGWDYICMVRSSLHNKQVVVEK
jgi:hypothetical protein